jgi:cephalosporin-C deacetylase-like acetyl esterase
MGKIKMVITRLVGTCVLFVTAATCGRAADIWDLPALWTPPPMRWVDQTSPIRSLTFQNESYRGQPTDVFAFYATPGTISGDPSQDHDLPAVVLLHGGGGTAFAEWVTLWANRGYAAIAIDLCGNRPSDPRWDSEANRLILSRTNGRVDRKRLERAGPPEGAVSKFQNVGGDVHDDWQYHAVAAAIRAHSLVRSFPEVDAERTAVTGISWGGYLTCLVASIDDRFKAAVPVYGCGFLHDSESVQRGQIDALSDSQRQQWINEYDPSAWLSKCRVPMLFVNGTNDKHYPLRAYARTVKLVAGDRVIRIEPNMRHSHPAGWAPKEIGWFIDQHLRGGTPLAQLGPLENEGGVASATVTTASPIEVAQLHYTSDGGPLVNRVWKSVPATVENHRVRADTPEDATVWMLAVTDRRGAMVSTSVAFRHRP